MFPDEIIVLDDSDEEEGAARKASEHVQSANSNKTKSEPSAQSVAITHGML